MSREYMKLPEQPYIKDSGFITTVYGTMIARVGIHGSSERKPLSVAFELYHFKDFGQRSSGNTGRLVARHETDIQHSASNIKLKEDTDLSDDVATAFAHSQHTSSDSSSPGLLFTPDQIVIMFGPLYDSARKESHDAWREYTLSQERTPSRKH